MTIRIVAAMVLLLGGIGVFEPLLACGEKFLIRSRGTRFQRAAVARTPASILIFTTPAALANVPVDAALRKAGYRPTTVATQQEFDGALGRGGWDLVVVDAAGSGAVMQKTAMANPPIVLPVAFNATSAEVAAAKKQYKRVLKTPVKQQSFLDAIDDALASRPKAATRTDG
jgi:DNA-binding NtrC family response regulator